MSLISRMLHAVRSWRRRPGGLRTDKRAAVAMELLDHRQLLSVNFTGNVPTDFPATQQPGVVVLPNNPNVVHPAIPSDLSSLIAVSGFDVSSMRVSYDPTSDILSIGIDQPPSGNAGQPGVVISGDADDNGDDGTTNPAVQAVDPGFVDFGDFGGSEFMGAFLDLQQTGLADIVAGYSATDARTPKEYQVATALVNPNAPTNAPGFGTALPQFTGNVYKVNSPAHPSLEFDIDNFSKLYLQETGQKLSPTSVVGVGGFGGSGSDGGISEAFFPEQTFPIGNATPPPTCPPLSPPVLVNPHAGANIDTAHPSDIRVNVFGSSGFDVNDIDPKTVTLGGAHPIFAFTRKVPGFPFPEETFIFKGTDVNLPPGKTTATITGQLKSGQINNGSQTGFVNGGTFTSTVPVFNKNDSFYSAATVAAAKARQAADPGKLAIPISVLKDKIAQTKGTKVTYVAPPSQIAASVGNDSAGPVVAIKKRQPVVTDNQKGGGGKKVSPKLQASLNQFLATSANGAS